MESEPLIRLGAFAGTFALCALWEIARAARPARRGGRWATNLGLLALDSLLVRLLFPAAAVGAALHAEAEGHGLLPALGAPLWLAVPLTVLLLDFAIWAQHVLVHKVPLFWRFHSVHHADEAMDATTGLRFHPVEIAASMALKIGLVYALGAPALGVLVFEILLNAFSIWTHSNLRMAERWDRALRRVLVTPAMHLAHHSTLRAEHDTNFGFLLSVWDRAFGCWTERPPAAIGLPFERQGRSSGFLWSLALPFRRAE